MVKRTARTLMLTMLLLGQNLPMAAAQVVEPPIPCPWWDCGNRGDLVVEEYRIDVTIDRQIATTHITQILRNDADWQAEGEFLFPLPTDAAATDLQLWIDGEPVAGDVLSAEEARETYEEIVRRTQDPALLEFVDDGLLRLSVFPIPAGDTRRVEIEYTQILEADGGLVRYRHPIGQEHGDVTFESTVARIEILDPHGIKTIYSPTHAVAIDRIDDEAAVIGYEATGTPQHGLAVYYTSDETAVSASILSYRDGADGWFALLASPGLVADDAVTAKDVAIVIDVSGSMEGDKLDQAKRAAGFVLDHLNATDRFSVLSFSTGVRSFSDGLNPARNAPEAISWVNQLSAGGATDIELALSSAFGLEDERPLYVLFITDGLPTEGVIDTEDILDSLSSTSSATSAVFAFGVGYDVDTVLLDSIAQQHNGTTEYVLPEEQIDDSVALLYSKVASPVLTDLAISVDGVDVWDLHPNRLPDLFSGEQFVLTGRYDDWGPATIRLSGRLQGEPVTFEYDDVRFSAAGGDDSVPGLWATRKIGALLRQIRIEGPTTETIDQIVRLSIRHGIVTPYTSFLVTEPAPIGEEAIGLISERATATTTMAAPSGEAAVIAADAAGALTTADRTLASDEFNGVVATAAGRTFRLIDGVWVDTTFEPDMDVTRIGFGSDDYFALATRSGTAADALAVGPRLIVVVDGVAIEIVDPAGPTDALPLDLANPEVTPPPQQSDSPVPEGGEDDNPAAIATVALLSAMAAVAGLAVVTGRR